MLWSEPFAPLRTQVNRFTAFAPVGDLSVSERHLMLTLDLPGLTSDDLSIDVQGNELTVRGERKRPQVDEGAAYVYLGDRLARSSTASRFRGASIPTASPPACRTACCR